MVQGQMTQMYEDHCIYSDSQWFCESFSFSLSVKSTGIDHIAVLADSNNLLILWLVTFILLNCGRPVHLWEDDDLGQIIQMSGNGPSQRRKDFRLCALAQ